MEQVFMTLLIKSIFKNFSNVDIEVKYCDLFEMLLNQQTHFLFYYL